MTHDLSHLTENYADRFVEQAILIGALELLPEGRALNSGRWSYHFYNSGLYCRGSYLEMLATSYAHAIAQQWETLRPEVIFGPAYKGITLASATAVELHRLGYDIAFAYNRKEEKQHAEKGKMVGSPVKGLRTVIIDDVITDGATKEKAVKDVRDHEGILVGLIIGFDRHERSLHNSKSAAQDFSERHAVPVISVANVRSLIKYLSHPDAALPPNVDRLAMLRLITDYCVAYAPEDL